MPRRRRARGDVADRGRLASAVPSEISDDRKTERAYTNK
jgi:hypothetical protein